jgi:hypothetical protein
MVSANFMRLSLEKGAHAVFAKAACRKFGASRSFFARCGIPQVQTLSVDSEPNALGVERSCIPHLAKNERDVGGPGVCCQGSVGESSAVLPVPPAPSIKPNQIRLAFTRLKAARNFNRASLVVAGRPNAHPMSCRASKLDHIRSTVSPRELVP